MHNRCSGAGRPPAYREPLVRKTVTLPVSYVEQLTTFGAGNLSDGIRLLAEGTRLGTQRQDGPVSVGAPREPSFRRRRDSSLRSSQSCADIESMPRLSKEK
jgi:hypothetical protein